MLTLRGKISRSFVYFILAVAPASGSFGRAEFDRGEFKRPVAKIAQETPYVTLAVHSVGQIGLTVINKGQFGNGYFTSETRDPVTGVIAPSCQYPYPGPSEYLFTGTFWIGAVIGRDTLVSVGADGWHPPEEMWPDPYPDGDIERHSITNAADLEAVSEQDFICRYTDTITNPAYVVQDVFDGRPHIPLGIEITQRSYAWGYSYADDFILFDYSIKNISRRLLNGVYMGFYVDGDVGSTYQTPDEALDDICGFRRAIDSPYGCGFKDTINIAWIADNNGRNDANSEDNCPFGPSNQTAVTGMRVVRTPSDSLKYSFNWWISNNHPPDDWGPRKAGTPEDPFRVFGQFLGTPMGDRNKYYIMRHEEFDYDQLFCAKDHTAEGWLPRPSDAYEFANGYDTRYLLSFGPFDISPGEVLPISFAYVAGEDFLTDCDAYDDIFNPNQPEDYYNTFNFDNFGSNAVWAAHIYDNPGVDTDNDGYMGRFRVCQLDTNLADTIYYEGDGVPDFRGASPPPAPELWVISDYPVGDTVRSLIVPSVDEYNQGEVLVRWYGYKSETTKDVFSNLYDFEGYRVWLSMTDEQSGFHRLCSYDIEDYNRYVYNSAREQWELNDAPFSIDELRDIYGDGFNPGEHDRDHPLYWHGNSYYFAAQDWNRSGLSDTCSIHKTYPNQLPPSTLDHDSAAVYYPEELTDEGYFKYYMYQFKIRNLLPSQRYYFAVTAFDFGSPASNLESLENQPAKNFVAEFPQNQNRVVASKGLNVIAYPNPYRIDGGYFEQGYEGRGKRDIAEDRRRRIHFTNLPHRCTIRIFSIDGDLIREIVHDMPEDSPESMHEEWDLITRNTQAVVSGIYYYSVDSEYGNQIGKIVIIM